MNNKLLVFLMNQIIGRWFFALMNVIAVVFNVYCVKFMIEKMLQGDSHQGAHGSDEMNILLNGNAGILIALGVLMESRITIMKMCNQKINDLQHYLNESAEYSGMGILVLGLFVEIFTVMIEAPNEVVNTQGVEVYLYSCSIALILISISVEAIYIKDTIMTYFRTPHTETKED
ncbi:MAG: hypothetical protein ACYDCN_11480 [Bacteroidia bacterium]